MLTFFFFAYAVKKYRPEPRTPSVPPGVLGEYRAPSAALLEYLNLMQLPLNYLSLYSGPVRTAAKSPVSAPVENSSHMGFSENKNGDDVAELMKKREAPRKECNYSTKEPCKHQCVKKSFGCKSCDKVYASLGALNMHIRTHTLPCKCKLCGKAFSRMWLLQGHIRTHTGEKPFPCPHCNHAFADPSNLRAHLQTHSDVKKYSCNKCSKTFSRIPLLHKHVLRCVESPIEPC